MHFSKFATRFSSESGIVNLMYDLGSAMAGDAEVLMLGGGNPGHIPAVQQYFHERMQRILEDPAEFAHIIGNYDSPQGEKKFIEALAEYFRKESGWEITSRNIALTAGSQAGFFLLFNMFGGEYGDGSHKRILLPLTPEYIGYSDVGLVDNLFTARRPLIHKMDEHTFKYHIDFDQLKITKDIGALCVSRPTNPTGNLLTDDEMEQLTGLAGEAGVPLIIDNAYGMPFPNIIFTEARLNWDENTILCMSLSKLGLPGARTGIIVAREEIIRALTNINAVLNLALGSFGPSLALDLVNSGEISRISEMLIKPFYRQKVEHALALFRRELDGVEYYIHKAEGAIFLWLWLPGMPISAEELYRRLKSRGVLIIPGHYFFPGLEEDWTHKHECIRVTYSMQDEVVEEGVKIIAGEIRAAFDQEK
ncbi:MAG TPA: valine--pyruvate transaminase [Gammaproteobacteria bacterium]|nr:valine--pyruvate transaminase [Gammaproteobacteria bacterium]